MATKRTPGLRRRGKQGIWSIQKTIRVRGKSIRLCETTGTRSLGEAERYLARRIEELRSIHVYGEASPLTLAEAGETGWTDNVIELRQKRGKLPGVCARVE